MTNGERTISDIVNAIQDSRKLEEALVNGLVESFDPNPVVLEFVKSLSKGFDVPDNDHGPFDSLFCSRLERLVEEKLRGWIKVECAKQSILNK